MNRSILVVPVLPSTNDWVKQHIEEMEHLSALRAETQTAGRGRRGRSWADSSGQGLYISYAIRRPLPAPGAFPLLAALAVRRALENEGAAPDIKWPNDFLYGGRKAGGVLCEQVAGGLVCGIGLNLLQPQHFFDENNLPAGTSVYLATGVNLLPHPMALAIQKELHRALPVFIENGFTPFLAEYEEYCVNLSRQARYSDVTGIARRVLPGGELEIELPDGTVLAVTDEVHTEGLYNGGPSPSSPT